MATLGEKLDIGGQIFDAAGNFASSMLSATAYDTMANYARKSAGLVKERTAFEQTRQRREAYRTIGGVKAAYGASGIMSSSGSALDVLKSSAAEAALDAEFIRIQGEIDYNYYKTQETQYEGARDSAKAEGTLGGIGDLLSIGASIAAVFALSDARLKTDIRTVTVNNGRRWVTYRYLSDPIGTRRFGVIAQEVMQTDPGAVTRHESGFYMVDYSKLLRAA